MHNSESRKWMNQKHIGKHTIQCFSRATYHMCVFNMACAGTIDWDDMPFPSRPVWLICFQVHFQLSVLPDWMCCNKKAYIFNHINNIYAQSRRICNTYSTKPSKRLTMICLSIYIFFSWKSGNLLISSTSHKNNISHYSIVSFLRYTHPRYMKRLFKNIQKQQNIFKK